jgi:sortase (surface protein transpeptidase)
MNKKKIGRFISNSYIYLGIAILVVATILILNPLYPYIWFQINNNGLEKEQANIEEISKTISVTQPINSGSSTKDLGLPPLDETLPENNTLIIPSIELNGVINEDTDSYQGLLKGIWRVPDWGNPLENDSSIILAAHRFGYLNWSREFRKLNSFQSLPKTGIGDRVEIIWEQRRYVYDIYEANEGTSITDYDADLILYTCKTMNSTIRVFRYANRVE